MFHLHLILACFYLVMLKWGLNCFWADLWSRCRRKSLIGCCSVASDWNQESFCSLGLFLFCFCLFFKGFFVKYLIIICITLLSILILIIYFWILKYFILLLEVFLCLIQCFERKYCVNCKTQKHSNISRQNIKTQYEFMRSWNLKN